MEKGRPNCFLFKRVQGVGTQAMGEKKIHFWQKHSPNCDFLVLHSPSTLSTSKNI
jgi:hypothetical protein